MACNVRDEDLYKDESRIAGQTVLITGGASGIGEAAVLQFAKRGGKLVIGDINEKAAQELVTTIRQTGGTAIWKACDVLEYDDQRDLFESALEEFGSVDLVVANAGIAESSRLFEVKLNKNGRPVKPKMKTIEMNIISVIYTAQLASFYFSKTTNERSLKSLVLTASMLSFTILPTAPMYCSSKFAVLGLMRSLTPEFQANGFRISTVHPWFVGTHSLGPRATKNLMFGIPLSPVHRVAGAIVLAATDSSPETNGAAYTIPDEREVFRIPPSEINEDVYALLSRRARSTKKRYQGLVTLYALAKFFLNPRVFKLLAYGASVFTLWVLTSYALPYTRKILP